MALTEHGRGRTRDGLKSAVFTVQLLEWVTAAAVTGCNRGCISSGDKPRCWVRVKRKDPAG